MFRLIVPRHNKVKIKYPWLEELCLKEVVDRLEKKGIDRNYFLYKRSFLTENNYDIREATEDLTRVLKPFFEDGVYSKIILEVINNNSDKFDNSDNIQNIYEYISSSVYTTLQEQYQKLLCARLPVKMLGQFVNYYSDNMFFIFTAREQELFI